MQDTHKQAACVTYEIPAKNLENLYNIFTGIQKALVLDNTETAQELCSAGQLQLRDVVICFES